MKKIHLVSALLELTLEIMTARWDKCQEYTHGTDKEPSGGKEVLLAEGPAESSPEAGRMVETQSDCSLESRQGVVTDEAGG